MLDINNPKVEVGAENISVGDAIMESNGHKMSRLEIKDLEETMKSIKMKVLSFKANIVRLVK